MDSAPTVLIGFDYGGAFFFLSVFAQGHTENNEHNIIVITQGAGHEKKILLFTQPKVD